MKKIKLLTSLTALATIGTTVGVLSSCSCNKNKELVEVDASVTKQGVTVKSSNIQEGKQSTIELSIPSGKTLKNATVIVNGKTLTTPTITISGNKIIIPADKMTVAKVTLKSVTLESTGKVTKTAFVEASKKLEAKRDSSNLEYSLDQITKAKINGQEVTKTRVYYTIDDLDESDVSLQRSAYLEYEGGTSELGIVLGGAYYTVEQFEERYPTFFKDETATGVTYKVNTDGSVEYTDTTLTSSDAGIFEWKMNQYGYLERIKIQIQGSSKMKVIDEEMEYQTGGPTINSKFVHFPTNTITATDFKLWVSKYGEINENELQLEIECRDSTLTADKNYNVTIKQGTETIATNAITFKPQTESTEYKFTLTAAEFAAYDPTAGDLTLEAEEVTQDYFIIDENTGLIKLKQAGQAETGTINVPAKVNNIDVKGITARGFEKAVCKNVVFAANDNFVTINPYAFDKCDNLESVTFANTMRPWTVQKDTDKKTVTVDYAPNNATYLTSTYDGYTWTNSAVEELYLPGPITWDPTQAQMTKVSDEHFTYKLPLTADDFEKYEFKICYKSDWTCDMQLWDKYKVEGDEFFEFVQAETPPNSSIKNLTPGQIPTVHVNVATQKIWIEEADPSILPLTFNDESHGFMPMVGGIKEGSRSLQLYIQQGPTLAFSKADISVTVDGGAKTLIKENLDLTTLSPSDPLVISWTKPVTTSLTIDVEEHQPKTATASVAASETWETYFDNFTITAGSQLLEGTTDTIEVSCIAKDSVNGRIVVTNNGTEVFKTDIQEFTATTGKINVTLDNDAWAKITTGDTLTVDFQLQKMVDLATGTTQETYFNAFSLSQSRLAEEQSESVTVTCKAISEVNGKITVKNGETTVMESDSQTFPTSETTVTLTMDSTAWSKVEFEDTLTIDFEEQTEPAKTINFTTGTTEAGVIWTNPESITTDDDQVTMNEVYSTELQEGEDLEGTFTITATIDGTQYTDTASGVVIQDVTQSRDVDVWLTNIIAALKDSPSTTEVTATISFTKD